MLAALHRARAHLGRRGTALIILGAGKVCFGFGLIADPPSTLGLGLLTHYASLRAWAWLWVLAGAVVLATAWVRIGRDTVGFVVALVPPLVWAFAYLTAAADGTYPRGLWIFGWYMTSHVGLILWASTVPEHSVPHDDGSRV